MVEYTFHYRASGNQYWRLPNIEWLERQTCRELRARLPVRGRHRAPISANKARLAELEFTHQRGLVKYEVFLKDELIIFCRERRLHFDEGTVLKVELIQLLEQADDKRSLDKFADLPPELRVHIYELYFKSFPPLSNPAQPPITKVCRLIREESLPVFFKTCNFVLHLDRIRRSGRESFLRWTPAAMSRTFLKGISAGHLAMICKLFIRGVVEDGDRAARGQWSVDLGKGARWPVVQAPKLNRGKAISAETNKRLVQALVKISESVCNESEEGTSSASSVESFLQKLEDEQLTVLGA